MNLIQKTVIDKGYSLKDLNLKTPEHVYALHVLIRATGAKDKTLDLLLDGAKLGTLPNIVIDSTFADLDDMKIYIPKFLAAGYKVISWSPNLISVGLLIAFNNVWRSLILKSMIAFCSSKSINSTSPV